MDVLKVLDEAGAVLLDRHFVYKSKKHGPNYINMDPLFPDVGRMQEMCRLLVEPFEGQFDTVTAPATGGIELAVLAALAVGTQWGRAPAMAVWADKDGDNFAFERAGFVDHLRRKRVLVVEDLLNTGGSVISVCREAEKHGAEVISVSVICNRGGATAEQLGVPRLEALTNVTFTMVAPDECELCAKHVPIVEDIGHGAVFKTDHPDYPGGYIKLLAA